MIRLLAALIVVLCLALPARASYTPINGTVQKMQFVSTSNGAIGTLPANSVILAIILNNGTANAVTGGVSIGSTALGIDVVNALAVGANAYTSSLGALLLKNVFSGSASQQLFASAAVAWNSASVTITVLYVVVTP